MGCAIGRKNGIQRKEKINCLICGNEFFVWPYEIKIRHKVTCSKECSKKWNGINPNKKYFEKGHNKIGGFSIRHKHSDISKKKMSLNKKGKSTSRKGSHFKSNDALKVWREKGGQSWNKGLKGFQALEKHPNWKGGLSFEPYTREFNKSLKEKIRFIYGYRCFICGCSQLENGKNLDIHHIDYNKKNCLISNLVSLCMHCHRKTNYKRDYWIKFFKDKSGVLDV